MERISIVVPVYNVGKYLCDFIEKMLEQTYQDFKIYAVYDISTDDTLHILKEYEVSYPEKLEIIYSTKKDGLGAARDFALNSGKITGEFIMFLDPDDYPEKIFLERLVTEADKSGADITACGFDRFDDVTGKIYCIEMTKNKIDFIENFNISDISAYINPSVWNKLYRRKLIEDIRFTNIKRAEDLFYLLRMLPRTKSIKFINEVLYHYRVRYDSLSSTITEDNYYEFLKNMTMIRDEYKKELPDYEKYIQLLEMMMFIHTGIAMTFRLVIGHKDKTSYYLKYSKQYFDKEFPGWRKNKYLGLKNGLKRGTKGIGIWGCRLLYKLNLFIIFIQFYDFIQTKLKLDIKW